MKREDLRKLGLTDEQVDQVMSMNGDDVNAQKAIVAQRDETITALTTERDGLKEQVTARDKDIADLKKAAGDNESLNKQLSDLQTKYNDDTAKLQKSLDDQARAHAIEGLFGGIKFTSAFAKRAAMKEFEAAGLEFKDGKFTDADATIKKMREQNPDAFEPEKKPEGTPPAGGNPPKFTNPINPTGDGGNGGNTNPFSMSFTPVRNTQNK